jgi:ribosome-associated translation inhibitor RaiA
LVGVKPPPQKLLLMKLTIRNRNLSSASTLDTVIETRLLTLAARVRIEDATVTVERSLDASPPYRVEIHLAVPGPDLRAERSDNTPLQAFTGALAEIERHLRERAVNRLGRATTRVRRTSTPGMRASRFS